jgi:hypothetical protein
MANIKDRIDLLQEQIEDIEKSGFYTEKEINQMVKPLNIELQELIKQDSLKNHENARMTFAFEVFKSQEK